MGLFDWLTGKPKVAPDGDPVGPVGGPNDPPSPYRTGPWINSAGTWDAHRGGGSPKLGAPNIEAEQQIVTENTFPADPLHGNQVQRELWPLSRPARPFLAGPTSGPQREPDPKWNPPPSDMPVRGHISYSFDRPWYLSPRLDGNRTTVNAAQHDLPDNIGTVGLSRSPRATMFVEPAPWGTDVVDTTAATGSATVPGRPATREAVRISPDTLPRGRAWRLQ